MSGRQIDEGAASFDADAAGRDDARFTDWLREWLEHLFRRTVELERAFFESAHDGGARW